MKKLLSLSLLFLLPFSSYANWTLNNNESSVNYISIKKSSIGEVNHFGSLTGSLKNGKANVTIDLASVDTNIPIRDERTKSMLFEVTKFAQATIEATVDEPKIRKLEPGSKYQDNIKLTVSLHGVTKEIEATVQVVKLSGNRILVSSVYPLIVKASDFELSAGIESLRKVAKLPVISSAVPVSFNLVFTE